MTDQPEKKLFIDEDWKAKVEAEKDAARHPVPAAESAPDGPQTSDNPLADQPDLPLPPASLTFLLTTLATQAMVALGQIPNPITGRAELRFNQAKHVIDTLGMLEKKTAGNRTPEESGLLDDLLHQLRIAFVALQSRGS